MAGKPQPSVALNSERERLPPIGHLLKSIATFGDLTFLQDGQPAREAIAAAIEWWECDFADFLERFRQLDAHNRELIEEAVAAANIQRTQTARIAELEATVEGLVTAAMVERALRRWYAGSDDFFGNKDREEMRATLIHALAPPQPTKREGEG